MEAHFLTHLLEEGANLKSLAEIKHFANSITDCI